MALTTFKMLLQVGVRKGLVSALAFLGYSTISAGSAWAGGIFYSVKAPTTGGKFELIRTDVVDGPPSSAKSSTVSTSSFTCSNCTTPNKVNGFSFDPTNRNIFFFNSNVPNTSTAPTLYYVSLADGSFNSLGSLAGFPALYNQNMAGASYYNGSIYAVENNTNQLVAIPISYSGSTPTVGAISSITLPTSRAYGDIAINPKTGILYGYTTQVNATAPVFYSFDLKTQTLLSGPTTTTPSGMQIAFDPSYSVLYGVTTAGAWYTIDQTTGAATSYAASTNGFVAASFNDLAGSEEVPGPLPLLGAAAAFRASRKIRQRVKCSGSANETA